MKLELQTELLHRYPRFFRKPGERFVELESISNSEQLVHGGMPFDEWGVECGDGWFSLIDRLSCACENEIERLASLGVPKERWPRVAQIKEKFGSLRFYSRGSLPDDLREQILKASEEESRRTCEQCGAPKKLQSSESWRTCCDDCAKKSSDERVTEDKHLRAQLLAMLASRTE
ncbi:hypothetical protein [Polaromonas hydrogenivorans]|uniref:Uncharacterized protein n=1 Tax=Polaromonas hydrogenivorans TaxID=335476 RepID=A0AAU7LWL5_9BURK